MAWTASEPMNRLLLADAPALVLSPDGAHMLWANPSGAARLGAGNLETLLQDEFPDALPLRRQIAHLFRWLRGDQEQVQRLRLGRSASTPLDMVRVRKLRNLDGVSGVLLQPVGNKSRPDASIDPAALTDWLASGHHYAALLSDEGDVIAASGAFQELRQAAGELQDLMDTAEDSTSPVSRHLNIAPGVRHLVTAFKMGLGGQAVFLLLVDAEEVPMQGKMRPVPMASGLIDVPTAANDSEPVTKQNNEPSTRQAESQDVLEAEVEQEYSAKQDAVSQPKPAGKIEKRITQKTADTTDVMRFVWRMDDAFKFTFVSPEFQRLVGLRGAFEGRSWQDLAGDYQLDPEKTVQKAIASKDMWGGHRVIWALPKRKSRAEIELSAMPVFNDERKFQGYRGFGSCRLRAEADGVETKDASQLPTTAEPKTENTSPPESKVSSPVKAETVQTPSTAVSNKSSVAENAKGLTLDERKAFEEIGRTLGHDRQPTETPAVVASEVEDLASSLDQTEKEVAAKIPEVVAPKIPDVNAEEKTSRPLQNVEDIAAAIGVSVSAEPIANKNSAETDLRTILDQLDIGVLVVRDDRLLYANKHLAQMAGYEDTDSYLSASAASAMGGFALDPVKNSDGVMLFTGMNEIAHCVRATIGKIGWMGEPASLLVVDPVPEQTNTGSIAKAVDGTETWSAEELLAILNTATEGVLMINSAGKILALNHGAEALFGESQSVLKGRDITQLLAPESHKVAHDYLHSILGAGVASVLNDGRDVIGCTAQGGYMPLFMTMGRVGEEASSTDQQEQRLCVVLRDITQWKRAEDDLIAARHNAEKANTAKSDFLAKISHEIRTPLNAILGFSEVIMGERFGPIGNPRYKDYIGDIHTSGAHLINLVNDMLDISKIEAGQLDLSFAAVDLCEILKECVALMQPQANEARVIIRTSLSDDLPRIVADAKTIRQIALNLLSNSIKFTAEGGQVIVSAALESDGDLVLRVRDTGIGMNELDIATAMEPFRQVDSLNASLPRSGSRHLGGGTGLGLPLTKALVEANRAELFIESTPSEGTLIKVRFPNTRVLAE